MDKEYHRQKAREHYQRNKDKAKERSRKLRATTRAWFQEYKASKGCLRCGETRYWRLAFHHKDPTMKEGQIGWMSGRMAAIKREVEKCDVLCHNCHADLHHEERTEVL